MNNSSVFQKPQSPKVPKPIFLSVIFSFRNEEENLQELIRRTRSILDREHTNGTLSKYELVFINDASTDRSQEILVQESQSHDDIRIINMSRSFGVTPCVIAGFEYSSGEMIIYMDSDLQDPPEVIPELLEKWREDTTLDVIHTVRLSRQGESALKLFVTKIGYHILNKFSSIYIPIEAGDFKLLSRRMVSHLLRFREKRPFMRGLISWVGFKQDYVPYHRASRYAGESKFHIFGAKVINNFFGSALISFSSAPLKIAAFLGILALCADFFLMIHVIIEKVQGNAIPGWTAIMIAILFMGGVQLFCVGIIGLYLNAVNEQTQNRPNFIIDSTFGFSHDEQKQHLLKRDSS